MITNLRTYNWLNALHGMRNPLKSWNKNDSDVTWTKENGEIPTIGINDLKLCKQLIGRGNSHRKFLRQIIISMDITASLRFFDQWSTYQFVVNNSSSQMYGLSKKGFRFKLSDFRNKFNSNIAENSFSNLIIDLNDFLEAYENEKDKEKRKEIWRDVVDLIPQSYMYTRTITTNYETFLAMYKERKNHKLEEWRILCDTLRKELPYVDEFIKVLEPETINKIPKETPKEKFNLKNLLKRITRKNKHKETKM